MKLFPTTKNYIWGGTKLKDIYGKISDSETIAESWEFSVHKDGVSRVAGELHGGQNFANPLYDGLSNDDMLIATDLTDGSSLDDGTIPLTEWLDGDKMGNYHGILPEFMIKLIDAQDNLSVQVHPNDSYAKAFGDNGKREMWYIVDCEDGAGIYCGLKRDVTNEELEQSLNDGSIMELLNFFEVKRGDTFFIEAGTIHAIGKGVTIYELQQSSNMTYRMYDFDRVGADGKPRALHIQDSLNVSILKQYQPTYTSKYTPIISNENSKWLGGNIKWLGGCKQFTSTELSVSGNYTLNTDNNSFVVITVIEGTVMLKDITASVEASKSTIYTSESANNTDAQSANSINSDVQSTSINSNVEFANDDNINENNDVEIVDSDSNGNNNLETSNDENIDANNLDAEDDVQNPLADIMDTSSLLDSILGSANILNTDSVATDGTSVGDISSIIGAVSNNVDDDSSEERVSISLEDLSSSVDETVSIADISNSLENVSFGTNDTIQFSGKTDFLKLGESYVVPASSVIQLIGNSKIVVSTLAKYTLQVCTIIDQVAINLYVEDRAIGTCIVPNNSNTNDFSTALSNFLNSYNLLPTDISEIKFIDKDEKKFIQTKKALSYFITLENIDIKIEPSEEYFAIAKIEKK